MGAATALMGAGFGVQGLSGIASGFVSAAAQRDQGRFAEAQNEISAQFAELAAEDAVRIGKEQASSVRRAGRRLAGQQRAAIAAQNIDVLTGSAFQARRDVEFFTDLDEITVQDMAWQRAFGMRVQANDYRFQGTMARASAEFNASQTILSGVSGALNSLMVGGALVAQGLPGEVNRPTPAGTGPLGSLSRAANIPGHGSASPSLFGDFPVPPTSFTNRRA